MTSSLAEVGFALNSPEGYVWLAALAFWLLRRSALGSGLFAGVSVGALASLSLGRYSLVDDLYFGQLGGCVGALTATSVLLLATAFVGIGGLAAWVLKRRRGHAS